MCVQCTEFFSSTCVSLKRMVSESICTIKPLITYKDCSGMVQLPRCKTWLQEACYDTTDPINCKAAYDFCSQLAYAYDATGQ